MVAIANSPSLVWRPHPGKQEAFLSSPAFEVLFGGEAGPGKSECLLMESLRQIDNPKYRAILFRRTFPMLEASDGLIMRSHEWFPHYGGRYNGSKHVWLFPTGARIYFGHMQHSKNMYDYLSAQFAYIGFDELSQFEEMMYMYLFTRCRVPINSGLRAYMRSATNPGNEGHEWVKSRFVIRDIVDKAKHFALIDDEDIEVESDHPKALSRSFIPASMLDNPSVDPEYRKRIEAIPDPVERARLLHGDWDIVDTTNRVYTNWSFENITNKAEYAQAKSRVYWFCDDGYATGKGQGYESYHPRVVLLAQRNNLGGLDIFAEYYETEISDYNDTIDDLLGVRAHAAIKRYPYPKPENAYVDSSAAMFIGALYERNVQAVPATHKVHEGIKMLRRMICDGNEQRLLRVHPRCEQLIYEMSKYSYNPNAMMSKAGERVPKKMNDHGPDALRYGAYSMGQM